MTQTLLDMTQEILSALDSDSVNSISDTVESTQVARIIQRKYYDIIARAPMAEQKVLYQFDASGDDTKPTLMTIPTGMSNIEWVKYFDSSTADSQQQDQFGAFSHGLNTDIVSSTTWTTTSTTTNTIGTGTKTFTVASSGLSITTGQGAMAINGTNNMFGTVVSYIGTTLVLNVVSTAGSGTFSSWTITNASTAAVAGYKYVTLLPIDQFLDQINRYNPSETNVQSFTFNEGIKSFTFYYKTNHQPKYCTIIENKYVIFDMYNQQFDTTLQAAKTLVYARMVEPFSLTDSFVPDLDDNRFPLLVNEAKALAFFELKQTPHMKAEQEIKRQWSATQKDKRISPRPSGFDELPNMGRVPRTGGYSSGGYGAYKWMRESGP
jgi:hypothetical protein